MNNSVTERFRNQMRTSREALGLSQRALGELLTEHGVNLAQPGIAKVEVGKRKPTLDEAFLIAELLGFPLLELPKNDAAAKRIRRMAAQLEELANTL